ncbi:ABC transporter substrate-binding protein [Tenacibaculum sp. S7007]|uniref:ABC transporter substrate-binding protein n=1 Tax=Tenacibaculum pelagium TaxID=2759527 RepID=A0A839AKM2_9FLAO|nr:helical backbone metal receptor [Tenacibaculum pelagium]MBA6155653.1 ABC transporter substrate-binding protein [Tenacibaculum pelagium]
MQFKDQINRVFELPKTPKRIISLVPSQTELLVDLGLENSIVGVTKFCIHPLGLKKTKTIVGGTKTINIEKIKSLNPDIILCNKEENTKEIVKACEQIAPTHVSDIYDLKDAKELINQYGEILSCETSALKINEELEYKINDFKQFIKNQKTIKVAYFIWRSPWMVAANSTFINHLLQLNNFKNIYANKERYPEVDIEIMTQESKPELILLSSEPYPFKEIHIQEIQKHNPNSKILLVDGELFSWYGSRLLKAFDYFKELRNRI